MIRVFIVLLLFVFGGNLRAQVGEMPAWVDPDRRQSDYPLSEFYWGYEEIFVDAYPDRTTRQVIEVARDRAKIALSEQIYTKVSSASQQTITELNYNIEQFFSEEITSESEANLSGMVMETYSDEDLVYAFGFIKKSDVKAHYKATYEQQVASIENELLLIEELTSMQNYDALVKIEETRIHLKDLEGVERILGSLGIVDSQTSALLRKLESMKSTYTSGQVEYLKQYGSSTLASGDPELALLLLREGQRLNPADKSFIDLINSARNEIRRIDSTSAYEDFDDLTKRADNALSLEKKSEALVLYKGALDLMPNNELAQLKVATVEHEIELDRQNEQSLAFQRYIDRGAEALLKNEFETAQINLENAERLKPGHPKAIGLRRDWERRSQEFYRIQQYHQLVIEGNDHYKSGRYETALNTFTKASDIFPDSLYARTMKWKLGKYLYRAELNEEKESSYHRVLFKLGGGIHAYTGAWTPDSVTSSEMIVNELGQVFFGFRFPIEEPLYNKRGREKSRAQVVGLTYSFGNMDERALALMYEQGNGEFLGTVMSTKFGTLNRFQELEITWLGDEWFVLGLGRGWQTVSFNDQNDDFSYQYNTLRAGVNLRFGNLSLEPSYTAHVTDSFRVSSGRINLVAVIEFRALRPVGRLEKDRLRQKFIK